MLQKFNDLLKNQSNKLIIINALVNEIEDCKQYLEDMTREKIFELKIREKVIAEIIDVVNEHNQIVDMFNALRNHPRHNKVHIKQNDIDTYLRKVSPIHLRVV